MTDHSSTTSAGESARGKVLPRLVGVDALRACAASLVVLLHAGPYTGPLVVLKPISSFGWSGVGLFLVLSGFSIHFRWAASDVPHHEFTPRRFFTRRFFRLYPTYVVAVLVTVALLALNGSLSAQTDWVIAHGTQPAWVLGLNQVLVVPASIIPIAFVGVAWSLGLEMQLYVVYAAIARRIRRIGVLRIVIATLVIALVYRLASELVTSSMPQGQFFPGGRATALSRELYVQLPSRAFEWFLGVLAAESFFRRVQLPRWTRSPVAAAVLLFVAALIFRHPLGETHLNSHFFRVSDVLIDPLAGVGYFVLLLTVITRDQALASAARGVRGMVRALAAVGLFSYSLYLLHPVLLETGSLLAGHLGIGATETTLVMLALALVGSWLFHLAFERPFITGVGDRFVIDRLGGVRRRLALSRTA